MPTTVDPGSSRPIVLKPDKDGKTRIRNKKTGEVLVLHGYGSMEGKLKLRKGIDLTKPIYEQVLKLEAPAKRRSAKRRARKRADGAAAEGRVMSYGEMKVELTPDAAQWVEAALASGRFATAEDAVRYAINRAKRAELREMLEATEAEGGSYSSDDARRLVREHLDRLRQTSSTS